MFGIKRLRKPAIRRTSADVRDDHPAPPPDPTAASALRHIATCLPCLVRWALLTHPPIDHPTRPGMRRFELDSRDLKPVVRSLIETIRDPEADNADVADWLADLYAMAIVTSMEHFPFDEE